MPSRPASVRSSPSPGSSPTEVTSLLPSSSRTHSPPSHRHHLTHTAQDRNHARKTSVSARSVTGSVRNYGATRSPAEQAPRVSKAGQRRILTTLPIRISFLILVTLTFVSFVLSLVLLVNTALDLTGISLPYRGSGFLEFWLSAIGSWIGLGGILFFSHPSPLYFLTSLLTLILHIPILLLVLLNSTLARLHSPNFLMPFTLTALTVLFTLLSNYLVRRARRNEAQRISRMLTDAAAREREGEESTARAAVGLQKGWGGRIVGFGAGLVGLIAGLLGVILVVLLVIDLGITAYDSSVPLPSRESRLLSVTPPSSPWPIKVHLTCLSSKNSTHINRRSKFPHPASLPTVLYEPPSGVPGSLALLESPLPPSPEGSENPGRWLVDMQERGEVGRICVWDRPGYGFSEVLSDADLGRVAQTLSEALRRAEESSGNGFVLVGEGYGGLITRIFASRHRNEIKSILHLDAQTALTYFSENPNGRSYPALVIHRITTRLFPSVLTPLSLNRLPSALFRQSTSISRILASSYPRPSTVHLNENLRKARLQETFGSHSHTSSSFISLLESGRGYPDKAPSIVISSQDHMDDDEAWAEGQRVLAEEVTSDEGLVSWEKVRGVGHRVCEGDGKNVCEGAMRKLLRA